MSIPAFRPVLRYHGGKWRIAPWVVSHFPKHRVYVEPYGGAASVLLRKTRSYAEVYNDLDDQIVNLFRVLRDPAQAERLRELVSLTAFARAEFFEAYEPSTDPVEKARRLIVRSWFGHGSTGCLGGTTGFRGDVMRRGTTPATDWARWPAALPAIVERLRGVVIESQPADGLIVRLDAPDVLFYVDPPYPHSTRTSVKEGKRHYRHEMIDDDHRRLAGVLRPARGMVVLSGYACDLYDRELYPDWYRVERRALADGGRERTEVLWLSPATRSALGPRGLFDRTPV